jgi:TRAP-type uncharacterized transport system fused permease subunit
MMSVITPPLAPDAFVAAGISGASPMKTAVQAVKIGLIGLLIPFAMIYSPTLILIGSPIRITLSILTAVIGVFALGSAVTGFLFKPLSTFWRVVCFASALALIWPETATDLIGIALLIAAIFRQNPRFFAEILRKCLLRKPTVIQQKQERG